MSTNDPPTRGVNAAYEACERMARHHYENFPVASLLLPARMRRHVAAVYAFARVADDFADEPGRTIGERQRLLDGWLERLRSAAQPCAAGTPLPPAAARDGDLVFAALGATMRECRLPVRLFEDLLSAFRQDTWKARYGTFEEVLDYCRRSANPVGRIVLRIAGYDDERTDRASDNVCTALQLVNFWQDLERDWRAGRLYVPLEDIRAAGAREEDLGDGRLTPEWQRVMSTLGDRTRTLFLRGRPIADMVAGRLSLELRFTWLGGWRILERLVEQRFDVFGRRPTLRTADVPALAWRAFRWRAGCNP